MVIFFFFFAKMTHHLAFGAVAGPDNSLCSPLLASPAADRQRSGPLRQLPPVLDANLNEFLACDSA